MKKKDFKISTFLIIYSVIMVGLPLILGLMYFFVMYISTEHRIYTKEELEEGLISVEIVEIIDYVYESESYEWNILKQLEPMEQASIVEELSQIVFTEMDRPPTHQEISYALMLRYSNNILMFSLEYAVRELELSGKPIINEKFFPAKYNRDLDQLINKYLNN